MTRYCDSCGLPEGSCICYEDEYYEGWSCPTCGAQWGFEEFERQHCGACGYPDTDEDMYPLEVGE